MFVSHAGKGEVLRLVRFMQVGIRFQESFFHNGVAKRRLEQSLVCFQKSLKLVIVGAPFLFGEEVAAFDCRVLTWSGCSPVCRHATYSISNSCIWEIDVWALFGVLSPLNIPGESMIFYKETPMK